MSTRLDKMGRYVACYAAWVALGALSLLTTLQLITAASRAATYYRVAVLGVPPGQTADTLRQLGGIAQAIMLVSFLAWLGFVIFLEGYLRDGAARGRLGARAGRVAAITLALLGLAYLVGFALA